jgi:hypothetical protein
MGEYAQNENMIMIENENMIMNENENKSNGNEMNIKKCGKFRN